MEQIPAPKIIRSTRRTLSMMILPDRTIVIKAPNAASQRAIDTFIQDNQEWIEKRMKKIQDRPNFVGRQYVDGEQLMYLGKLVTLRVGNYSSIQIKGDELLFPQVLKFRAQKELTNWYITQAKEIITRQLNWYSSRMNLAYVNVSFADTKSRWGACTHDNRLQFNWRLIMAPLLTINYVIVHELTHTVEKNHSQAFWRKVRAENPSYRQQIKWLKDFGDALIV